MKLLLLLVLTSCAGMYKDYVGKTAVRETSIREYSPVDAKAYNVEDKNLSISYVPTIVDAGIQVTFKNKSNQALKIIWDESVYMSPSGTSEGIFHNGVVIAERASVKPPTVIPPQASHSDELIVRSHVEFHSSQYGSGWGYSPLCGTRDYMDHTLDDKSCIGQTFQFYVTYEINGKKQALTLKFKYIGSKPKPDAE